MATRAVLHGLAAAVQLLTCRVTLLEPQQAVQAEVETRYAPEPERGHQHSLINDGQGSQSSTNDAGCPESEPVSEQESYAA